MNLKFSTTGFQRGASASDIFSFQLNLKLSSFKNWNIDASLKTDNCNLKICQSGGRHV